MIEKYSGEEAGELEIPAEFCGHRVTEIGDRVFDECLGFPLQTVIDPHLVKRDWEHGHPGMECTDISVYEYKRGYTVIIVYRYTKREDKGKLRRLLPAGKKRE